MDYNIKLYALPFTRYKTFIIAAAMVAGNLILPALCHLVPRGGLMFLPIYFFTLLGAYKYGIRAGLLIAVLSPLLNNLLTGMPPEGMLPVILAKSVLIAAIASFTAGRFGKVSLLLLAVVVVGYQFAGTLFEWAYTGSLYTASQDFRLAFPGMFLQVFGVYAILKVAAKYGI